MLVNPTSPKLAKSPKGPSIRFLPLSFAKVSASGSGITIPLESLENAHTDSLPVSKAAS